MTTSNKSQVSSNCAQNLMSGVLLCLRQIPAHFRVSPEIPVNGFVSQMNLLRGAVDITTSLVEGLDYAAWQLMTATRDFVETGNFELNLFLPEELAKTLLRDRYIDPYVTVRFFRKSLRGPNGHHIKALYDNDKFLHSAAKYVLLRVMLQEHNLLNMASVTTNDLLSIAKNIFAFAKKNNLWMEIDENSKKLEENSKKLDKLLDESHETQQLVIHLGCKVNDAIETKEQTERGNANDPIPAFIQEKCWHYWEVGRKKPFVSQNTSLSKRKVTYADVFAYYKRELMALNPPITTPKEFRRVLRARAARVCRKMLH